MNIVMTKEGEFIEIQGTAEGKPFSKVHLAGLLEAAEISIKEVFEAQNKVLF